MPPTARTVLDAVADDAEPRTEQLRELVAIPSVSADPAHAEDVSAAADAVRDLLEDVGLTGTRLLEVPGGPPAVYGERSCGDPEAPTMLLYAHYDVQPPFDVDAWTHDPFDPVRRDGRLYGRGTADDKHGVVSIAWALGALDRNDLPLAVNVKVLCEGEEEVGSPNLSALLERHGSLLAADTYVIDDAVNERAGVPLLTATLRGLVDWVVTIRAMDGSGQHSGMYGGVVPDPRTALAKLIAGLVDDRGTVAIPGVREGIEVPDLLRERLASTPFDEEALRGSVNLRQDVPLAGDPEQHPDARLWIEPSLTVIGIDGPDVASASNTIAPLARAKLSLRIGPGQDPAVVDRVVREHLSAQRPLGLPVEVSDGARGAPFAIAEDHPSIPAALAAMRTAYGTEPTIAGVGGSIPMIAPLLDASPTAGVVLIGSADPRSNIHGIDESLDLQDWRRTTGVIALLLSGV